ncbi:MAG: GNAT family N-acetyltransferase [Bacteroidia bacterium]|nr:GNAT family N-acetyltransferase [Bacteroidia bacterium]
MTPIADRVNRELLAKELTSDIFVRNTNKANNQIYIFNGNNKPHLLREVGRLREWSFREAGGGTGKDLDLDEFDQGEYAYNQLIVWNSEDQEIVGGYRFAFCKENQDSEEKYHLSTTEILSFSDDLISTYFPKTIELGRSFVQPNYQPSKDSKKGIFSLDNLWDGLGALVVDYPDMEYFFGKITMYTNFKREARDLILTFMWTFFPDTEKLVTPVSPLKWTFNQAFSDEIKGLEYKPAYNLLSQNVRQLGEQVPPLFNSYMSLSPTMKTFGTAINDHFGGVEETGIMVKISDIYEEKKSRHVDSYLLSKSGN